MSMLHRSATLTGVKDLNVDKRNNSREEEWTKGITKDLPTNSVIVKNTSSKYKMAWLTAETTYRHPGKPKSTPQKWGKEDLR